MSRPIRLPWSATLFNVRPERLIPWLYVDPPSPDDGPGFRMNADGSIRSDVGTPIGLLAPPYPPPAQGSPQHVLGVLPPDAAVGAPSAGLANFAPGRGLLLDGGNGLPRQETPWTDRMPAAPQEYSVTAPASSTPPGVEPSPQLGLPQLPERLYRVLTNAGATAVDSLRSADRTARHTVRAAGRLDPIVFDDKRLFPRDQRHSSHR